MGQLKLGPTFAFSARHLEQAATVHPDGRIQMALGLYHLLKVCHGLNTFLINTFCSLFQVIVRLSFNSSIRSDLFQSSPILLTQHYIISLVINIILCTIVVRSVNSTVSLNVDVFGLCY